MLGSEAEKSMLTSIVILKKKSKNKVNIAEEAND